jgi:hypothetical protein
VCHRCQKPGHTTRNYLAHAPAHQIPAGFGQLNSFGHGSSPNFGNPRRRQATRLNTGERFSPDSPSEKLLEAAFDAINLYAGEDWIMDSGALAHFSGDRTTFSNLDSTKQRSVTSAGGQSHYIEGQGVAEIALSNGEIKSIRDVQYVLGLYRNILSIGKIVDLGHLALFDQAACFIISKEKPFRVIAKGTRTPGNGFYMLTQLAQNLDYAQQIHSLADHNACSNLTPHTESDLQKS